MRISLKERTQVIYTIAVMGFIYTLHLAVPIYSNSSFLSTFVDERTLGLIYMAGSAVSILGFLLVPVVIRKTGNYVAATILICIQIALFYGIIVSDSAKVLSILFIFQTAVVALIALTLDIFLESYTDGRKVGTTRGLYITTLNCSWVIAPLIGSLLINGTDDYRAPYIAALAMLFPLLYLVYRNFPKFKDPTYRYFSFWKLMRHIFSHKNWVKLFFANIILHTFYAWMVVYSPIYLHQHIGLAWEQIGIVLTVMLIPFVLVQYPLGRLADEKYGEKEILAIGFGLMAVSTAALSFLTVPSVVLWALGLFLTRIGAAACEIMLETYFFKTVSPNDSAVLGSFRVTRPLSYFVAPVVAGLGLLFVSHQYMFAVIGGFTLLGLYPALTIRDTK